MKVTKNQLNKYMNKSSNYFLKQKGVSLIELSVSIAIIGLLLATITVGQNLIHSAKIRKVITDFTNLHTAISEFEGSYGYMPGDMPTAFDFWGTDCGADSTGTVGDCNGDGDGAIEFATTATGMPQEDLLAIEHLALSDYISGSFTGQHSSATSRYSFNENNPKSEPFVKSGFMIRTEANVSGDTIYETRGHTIRMGSLVNNGIPEGGAVSAKNAYSIDMKIDDGKASSGTFYSIREDVTGSVGCVDNDWNSASANYDLDSTEQTCNLIYWYKKF